MPPPQLQFLCTLLPQCKKFHLSITQQRQSTYARHTKRVTPGTLQKYAGTNQAQPSQFLWNLSWNYEKSIPILPSQPQKTNIERFPQVSSSLRGDDTDPWPSRPKTPNMTLRWFSSLLSDDPDCDDVESADKRKRLCERGLTNRELEPEVMHILSARPHSPHGERIERHTRNWRFKMCGL